ncbi:MAG TPA: TonB-dependent receptor [Chondromyces sp.]|nr:TonB-dependent receptor [Chondromyces sp.]
MNRYLKSVTILAAAAVLLLGVSSAVAQETTGGLRGSVKDDVGTPIAGAVVEASGPLGTLATTTDQSGEFRFPRLAAGTYKVVAKYVGYLDAAVEVRVDLGQTPSIEFAMQQSFKEEITVYSDTIGIDFTESQVATSINKYEIDFLPRGRNFTDVVSFAPGTVNDPQAGGISIDGASGLENRYIIDGIDTTDPQIGSDAVPMRAEMFQEVQVKSAGYAAEFGGSTGGVINAVTRSGGNDFHGAVFVDYENNDWNGSERPTLYSGTGEYELYGKDDETRWDPGFYLSGPILRDRLWFFASYQPGLRTTDRTVDWPNDPSDTYTQDFQVDYVVANVTANIASNFLLKLGANLSPYETDGLLPGRSGRSNLPDQENYAPLGVEGERETYSLIADWIATDSFVVGARAGFFHTNTEDTGIPTFDLIHNYSTSSVGDFLRATWPVMDPQWQQNPGFLSDNLQTGVNQKDIYERTAYGVDATWFFQAAGEHSLKFGYQNEEIYNDVASGYNADRILYYWGRSITLSTGESATGEYGMFRLLNISTFGQAETNNEALFVQDAWSVTPSLTLNIGLRAESEGVPNFGATGPDPAIDFGYGDKIAPRLGFAWDITGDSKWKAYGSYGIYYDVTKYEMPRGSFGGDKWVDFWFTFDTPDPGLNDFNAGCTVGNNTIFDVPNCGAGTLVDTVDQRFNSIDPFFEELFGFPAVDPDLKPMESWEMQLGVDHQLTNTIQVGARYVHKEISRAIEDVGFFYPGVGQVYIIANPGEGIVADPQPNGLIFPKPKRDYDALELTFEKRFADNWSLRAYYTLSNLSGNYSGLANSDEQNNVGDAARLSPNVSRLYDVVESMYDQNAELVYGDLATNRTHQLGAQALYNFDFGLSVAATQYIGSGTPVSTIGDVNGGFFYPFGRGDLGETDWLWQTDLSLWQRFDISKLAFSVGVTVLNLFDQDAGTRFWTHRTLDELPLTPDEFAAGFDFNSIAAGLDQDPAFNKVDNFQAPRVIRLNFKLEF